MKDVLLQALSHGQSVVERRTTVPILSHVLLSGSSLGLSLTTTDIDMALIETIPADIEMPGTICVPVHLLYEIVKKMEAKHAIHMEYKDQRLHIASGRSKFTLSCLNPDEFPQLTHGALTHRFVLSHETFKKLIELTRFSMCTDDTKYYLNGIYFHAVEDHLRLVATDMHRLSSAEYTMPEGSKDMPSIIVGRKTIQEIQKLIDDNDQDIAVGLSDTRIECSFKSPTTSAVLTSRLIDGMFPDYETAITQEHDKRLVVSTKEFAHALDRVATVVNERIRAIKLRLERNKLILSAVSQEFGFATEELDVDYPYDESVEICFNVKYLIDVAGQIETETMEVLLTDSDSAILIHPLYEEQQERPYRCHFVVMPLRT